MSRVLGYVVIFGVVFVSFLVVWFAKESYRILPIGESGMGVKEDFSFQNWREFTAPSGKFTVLLPVLPQHATENVNDPETQQKRKYDMYVSEKHNGTIFMINLITLSGTSSIDREKILNHTMNDLISAQPGSQLKSM